MSDIERFNKREERAAMKEKFCHMMLDLFLLGMAVMVVAGLFEVFQ